MSDTNPRSPGKKHNAVEEAAEHVVEAVRDRVRAIEVGLNEGDHTAIGEIAGAFEGIVHPEGEKRDNKPRKRR